MQTFYTRLDQFLREAGLDSSPGGLGNGCSEAEIAAQERQYGVRFPLAYRLFLQWWGRTGLDLLEGDFRLDSLAYSWESARELLAENHSSLEVGGFVFSEWQGYNFFYFLLGADNPPVKLCIIKSDTELGLKCVDYGRFTDWLINSLKLHVKHRRFNRKIDVSAIGAELDRIAQLAD